MVLRDKLNLNAIPSGATFLPQNQDPTKVAANPTALLGSNAYDRDFLRRYPGFGDITIHREGSSSNFNWLQVGVNRRFSKGILLRPRLHLAHALGVTTGDGDFIRIDNLTRFANYGPLGIDRRHTLAVSYIYDLPSLFKQTTMCSQASDQRRHRLLVDLAKFGNLTTPSRSWLGNRAA